MAFDMRNLNGAGLDSPAKVSRQHVGLCQLSYCRGVWKADCAPRKRIGLFDDRRSCADATHVTLVASSARPEVAEVLEFGNLSMELNSTELVVQLFVTQVLGMAVYQEAYDGLDI
jgi:hypothetical protein